MRRNGVFAFALVLALAVVLLIAPAVSTGAGGDAITPATATETAVPGATISVSPSPTLHLDALPPKADVLFAFDTTASMGQAILDARSDASSIVTRIQNAIPSSRFAVADFRDYTLTPFGNGVGSDTQDYPWERDLDFSTSATAVQTALNAVNACSGCGSDLPEAYNRAFYEASLAPGDTGFRATQSAGATVNDSDLSWAAGAPRFIVVLGDSFGHDPNQGNDFAGACPATSPIDPGRDETVATADDLGTLPSLTRLKNANTNVSFVTYNPAGGPTGKVACQTAMAAFTGGTEVTHDAGTAPLGDQIVSLIKQAAARVDNVSFTVGQLSGPSVDSPSSWFTFTPPSLGPTTAPVDIPYETSVTVPSGQATGTYVFRIKAIADGIPRGSQDVTINVVTNAITDVRLSVDEQTLPAGVAVAPFSSIPASRIPFFTGATTSSTPYGSTPYGSTPFGSTPFGSTPYGSTPWGSTPFGSTPYGSTPYGSTPFGSTPWGSTPFGSTLLGSSPFGSTPFGSTPFEHLLLSQLPLVTPGSTWPDVLAGTGLAGQPLSSISLADVLRDPTTASRLDSIKLKDLSFASSLWQGVPVGAVLLGKTTVSQVPVPTSLNATSWQNAISTSGGCDSCIDPANNTFFGIAIAGALGSTNIGSIPFGSTPYGSTPGGSIPLTLMNIPGTRLAAVRLGDIIGGPSPFVTCPTAGLDCVNGTLGDAAQKNAIKSTATLAMLFDALPSTNPARQMTLDEIVGAVLPLTAYPWEQIPVQGLQDVAGTGKNAHYHVKFTLACSTATTFRPKVLLPSGFFPVAGSSTYTYGTTTTPTTTPAADPVVSPTAGRSTSAVWTSPSGVCTGASGGPRAVSLDFAAFSGLTLGDQRATASVDGVAAPESAPVLVMQNQESNDDPPTAPTIGADRLVVGHIANSGDKEYYRFALTGIDPNSRLIAFLKVPNGADYDLTLNGPSAPPIQSTPFGSTTFGSIPVPDQPVGVDNSGTTPQANTLADVPFGSTPFGSTPFGSTASGSISQNRGDASEQAAMVIRTTSTGFATIGVTGYNGSHSALPYVLRLEVLPAPPLPACQPRVGFDDVTQIGPLPAPSSLPQSTKALFLVDRQRLAKMYGSAAASTIVAPASAGGAIGTNLAALTARTDVPGAVLSVDGNAAVRAAYANWDTAGGACSPSAANGVVRAINDLVASYRAVLPNLKYVVLLGTDTAVPMYRQPDPTLLSPELDEAPDLAFTTSGLTVGNSLYAAVAQNQVLTDGAYGSFTRVQALDHELPVPQISVARMVESPADINGQLSDYLLQNGTLAPTQSLTTGYDFLTDGATDTNAALASGFSGLTANSLISSTWDKTALDTSFFGLASVPDIGALYGHYNHFAFKPAAPNVVTDVANQVATANSEVPVSASTKFSRHVIFTVGCHGGLNVGDELAGAATPAAEYRDWAQAYAQDSIAAYVGNTGFGYGDTDTVAASEKLMKLFAQNMNKNSAYLGDNWLAAVTDYLLGSGVLSAYDEKVMLEATYYGLPFWHFGTGTTTGSSGGLTPGPSGSPNFDIASAPVQSLTSRLTQKTGHDATIFWQGPAGTLAIPYRPIEPLASLAVTNTVPGGKPARDVFITSLTTHDELDPNPAKAYPVVNATANEPPANFANSFWPAGFTTLLRAPLFSGERDNVSINAGQYRPDVGRNRLVDSIGFDVTYSNSSDTTRPLISQAGATLSNGTTTVFIRVTDDSGIRRIAALYNDGTAQWTKAENFTLQPSGLYTLTVTGVSAGAQFGFEAMDGAGNVAQSWAKAVNFQSAVDTSGPDVVVTTPLPGQEFVLNQQVKLDFNCSDASGAASCTTADPAGVASCPQATAQAGPNLDTSTVGTHVLAVTAIDLVGNRTTRCVTYYVRYTFSGFRQPVDNPPVLNVAKPGSTIPVKWALLDAAGVSVSQLSAVVANSNSQIPCSSAPTDAIETTVADGTAGLKYDTVGQQFVYSWQTQKAWSGTCRRIVVQFADGSTPRYADFQFK